MLGRLRLPKVQPVPFAQYLDKYVNYMRHERGLSETTIKYRYKSIEDCLRRACRNESSFRKISINDVDKVLVYKGKHGYSRTSLKTYASSIRPFFQYAEQQKWHKFGLADAITTPVIYKDETLPNAPTWDDVNKLLESTVGKKTVDIRDRAILLLLAVYGFRASEVCQLCLDDLDWDKELIHIKRNKNRKIQQVPLSKTVGNAILRYLKKVRPDSQYREVFLKLTAPVCPITRSTIGTMVSRRWKSLGVSLKYYGTHSLRHACASRLINQGITLKEISDHLGHKSLDATRIYTKIDLPNLRKVGNFSLRGIL